MFSTLVYQFASTFVHALSSSDYNTNSSICPNSLTTATLYLTQASTNDSNIYLAQASTICVEERLKSWIGKNQPSVTAESPQQYYTGKLENVGFYQINLWGIHSLYLSKMIISSINPRLQFIHTYIHIFCCVVKKPYVIERSFSKVV